MLNLKNLYIVSSLFLNFFILFNFYSPSKNIDEMLSKYSLLIVKLNTSSCTANLINTNRNLNQEILNFRANLDANVMKIDSLLKILEPQQNLSIASNNVKNCTSIIDYNFILYTFFVFTLFGLLCYFLYNYGASNSNNICRCPTNNSVNSNDNTLEKLYQNSADKNIHSFETYQEAFSAENLALINRIKNEKLTRLPQDLDLMILPSRLEAAKNFDPIFKFVSEISNN